MNEIFGWENFRNEIVINRSVRIKTEGKKFPTWHETIFWYSNHPEKYFFNHITEERETEEWRSIDMDGEKWDIIPKDMVKQFSPENIKYDEEGNPISRARIILGKEVLPPKGRRFPPQEVINQLEKEGKIRFSKSGKPQMLKPSKIYLTDDWTGFYGYSFNWDFPTENSEILLKRVVESTSNEGDLILDFFLGSGTTTAVARKLRRKWIGVEMGEHFYTVVLPRMKKVLFYDKSGISKEKDVKERYNPKTAGGFFKYHTIEQYEDALENIEFEKPQKTLYELTDYFVKYMLEWETKNSKTFLNLDEMKDPFNYKLKIIENYQQKIVNVDLVETFNYLIGLNASGYEVLQENGRKYVFVFGEKEGKRVAIVWRSIKDIDFEKDKEVIEAKLKEFEPDEIYINGEALVKGFRHIEPLFKSLMFEEVR